MEDDVGLGQTSVQIFLWSASVKAAELYDARVSTQRLNQMAADEPI
jgi:hypothetical protein